MRVQAENDSTRMPLDQPAKPLRIFQCPRADHHAVDPRPQPSPHRLVVANAAAELTRNAHACEDFLDRLDIDRPAFFRAVEIDQVNAGRSRRFPARGHRRRVVAENRLPSVIPLS